MCPAGSVPLQALTQAVVELDEAQLQQRTEQARSWALQGPEGIQGEDQRSKSRRVLEDSGQEGQEPALSLSFEWTSLGSGDGRQGTHAGWPLDPFKSLWPPMGPEQREPSSVNECTRTPTPVFT